MTKSDESQGTPQAIVVDQTTIPISSVSSLEKLLGAVKVMIIVSEEMKSILEDFVK